MASACIGAGLLAALAVSLAGCGGSDRLNRSRRTLENPFAKEEGRCRANASPSSPIRTWSRSIRPRSAGRFSSRRRRPMHRGRSRAARPRTVSAISLSSDQLRKVWSADAGTGSSSSGRLSAVPLVADGKVYHARRGRHGCRPSPRRAARRFGAASVTPENEKSKEGFGGGLALDGGHLYAATGYGTVVEPRREQRRRCCGRSGLASRSAARRPPRAARSISSRPTTSSMRSAMPTASNLWTARGLPQAATLLSNVSPAVSGSIVVAPFPAGDVAAYRGRQRQGGVERFLVALKPTRRLPAFSAIRRGR